MFSLRSWLAQVELSTLSRVPRTISLSLISSRPTRSPRTHFALIRRHKLGIGGAEIEVRMEVEISYSAAAGGYTSSPRATDGSPSPYPSSRPIRTTACAEASVPRAFDAEDEDFVVPVGVAYEDDLFLWMHADRGEDDDATSRNGEDSVASPATSAHALEDKEEQLELGTRWRGGERWGLEDKLAVGKAVIYRGGDIG
jgi:hypothetical protein